MSTLISPRLLKVLYQNLYGDLMDDLSGQKQKIFVKWPNFGIYICPFRRFAGHLRYLQWDQKVEKS